MCNETTQCDIYIGGKDDENIKKNGQCASTQVCSINKYALTITNTHLHSSYDGL